MPGPEKTEDGPGRWLQDLRNAGHQLKEEMRKMESFIYELDLGPKEYAIPEVILKVARLRLDGMASIEEMRKSIDNVNQLTLSIRKPKRVWDCKAHCRATIVDATNGLEEARLFSWKYRIAVSIAHRELGTFSNNVA